MKARSVTKLALPVVLAASSLAPPAFSQAPAGGAGARAEVAWAVSVANRGIGTIPTSTLGKPAATLDVAIRHGRFGLNPLVRVGLDGTPWSSVLWGRYRLPDRGRLRVGVGAHPGLAFRTATVSVNGVAREVVVARRSAAGELAPNYALSRNVTLGAYYLYSRGLDAGVTRPTHFVAARAGLADLRLPAARLVARLDPQLYYLRLDDREGTYLNARATLARRDLPVSVSGLVNRPVRTHIPRGRAFLWNVSLTYATGRTR